MKLNIIRRIRTEDFPKEYQNLIEQLAYPINQLTEQLVVGLSKNITIEDNLPFEVITLPITVNSNVPTTSSAFKTVLPSVRGLIVLSAINAENDTDLNSAPFAQFVFDQTQRIVTINKFYGLPDDINFNITFLVIN